MISVPSAFPDGLSSIKTEPVTPWRNDPKLLATGALVSMTRWLGWFVREIQVRRYLTYNHKPDEFSWEHLVLTWTGFFGNSNMKLYHNGQLATNVTKQPGSGKLLSDANNFFTLGNRPQDNSSYFKGWMDDFRIWER